MPWPTSIYRSTWLSNSEHWKLRHDLFPDARLKETSTSAIFMLRQKDNSEAEPVKYKAIIASAAAVEPVILGDKTQCSL